MWYCFEAGNVESGTRSGNFREFAVFALITASSYLRPGCIPAAVIGLIEPATRTAALPVPCSPFPASR